MVCTSLHLKTSFEIAFKYATRCVFVLLLVLIGLPPTPSEAKSDFTGRWDLTLLDNGEYASAWLEIRSGTAEPKTGQLVWIWGGAEPLNDVAITKDILTFSHLFMGEHLRFTAQLHDATLTGTTTSAHSTVTWVGVRAPSLPKPTASVRGTSLNLLADQNLAGWKLRNGAAPDCWHSRERVLSHDIPCTDLKSDMEFSDFQLHLEFRTGDEGGSGIFLRGRYEVQIVNDTESQLTPRSTGAIFGHIAPSISATKRKDEWQTLDITLLGRAVTVQLNDHIVIANQEIPGITGGALDSNEGRPGPIMLQGDHGRVSFRNIVITPLLKEIP